MQEGALRSDPILGQLQGLYGFANDLLGECRAGSATSADTEATAQLREIAGPGAHSVADLLLGHTIAETDEHDQTSWMETVA